MDTCRVIQVIESKLKRRGRGQDYNDPIRIITEYYTLDGEKLAEVDPQISEVAPFENSVKLNKAEIIALNAAKELLNKFCNKDDYHCCEGSVNIESLFKKILP